MTERSTILRALRVSFAFIIAAVIIPAILLYAWQPVYGAGATQYYDPVTNSTLTSPATTVDLPADTTGNPVTLTDGWYFVSDPSGILDISGRITISGAAGGVNLILADGCTFNATAGITVSSGNSLTIYAQNGTNGSIGALNATGSGTVAGIGGDGSSPSTATAGTITINGGTINATGGDMGAGIGGAGSTDGATLGTGGNITINYGSVTANGGNNHGAGIGGGGNSDGGNITITGGSVNAYGGGYGGAGIGGGGPWQQVATNTAGAGGTIMISGGTIRATGNSSIYGGGAGIGGGGGGSPDIPGASGDITITGTASVTAIGGSGGGEWQGLNYVSGGGGGSAIGSGGGGSNAASPGTCGIIYIESTVTLNTTPGTGLNGDKNGAKAGIGGTTTVVGTDLDPTAPRNLTATGGDSQAVLNWNVPVTTGLPLTGYTLERSTDGGNTWTSLGDVGNVLTYTDTGLTNGSAYYYRITSVNVTNSADGVYNWSNIASVTPLAPPSAPQNVTAAPGSAKATVAFTAPSSDGGTAVTGYTVTAAPSGGGTPVTATGTASPITVSGLTNGTTYNITVTASNSAGTGQASSPAVSVTPAIPPSPPTGLTVTPGDSQITLSWTTPSNGGSAITSYDYSTDGGATWTAIPGSGASTTSYTIPGLTNGTTYTVSVRADNVMGSGTGSALVNATPIAPPSAPLNVSVTTGNAQAIVSFSPPSSNGGSAVTSYTVTAAPAGGGSVITTSGTNSPVTAAGLTNGVQYSFTVTATNAAGTGPASSPAVNGTPYTTPSAPQNVSVTAGNTIATVSFSPPSSDGGSAVTSYTVTATPSGGGSPVTVSGTSSPVNITGLTNGTTYSVTVTAASTIGTGPASTPVNVTPVTTPFAPVNLAAASGDGQVTLTWQTPANGGSPITSYQYSIDGGTTFITIPGSGAATTSYTVTGLTNGTSYTFEVCAVNAVGSGPAASAAAMPLAPPSPPANVSVATSSNQVQVTFSPQTGAGSSMTTYTVTATPVGGGSPVTISGATSPLTLTGLSNGTAYNVSVTASNANGSSTTSAGTVTPVTVPSAPQNVSIATGDGILTVSFSAPVSNGGSAITLYTVTATPSGGGASTTVTGTSSPINVTGLTDGTLYNIVVYATNSAGDGAPATSQAIPSTVPSSPMNLAATPGDGSISLTWNTPANDGGLPITGYYYSTDAGVTKTPIPGGNPLALSATISLDSLGNPLVNGTAYPVCVHAYNADGSGPASEVVSVTPFAAPGAPAGLTAAPGNGQVSLSWTAPANSASSGIASYQYSTDGGSTWATITGSGATTTNYTVTGLVNGTSYNFAVRAVSAQTTGASATASATPFTTPSAPTGVSVSTTGTQAIVTFSPPASTGGNGNITYTVTATPTGGGTPISVTGTTSPLTVSSLTPGTSYDITVSASNGSGSVSSTSVAAATSSAPSAPQNVAATIGNGQATITFSPPASNGGSAITGYTVTVSPGGQTVSGSSSPITVTGLTNGTAYTFTVTAANATGSGPASAPTASVTPSTPPAAPASGGLTTVSGNGQVTVSWTGTTSNGGSPITSYIVTATPVNGGPAITASGTASPITVTGLKGGTAYSISVTAVNAAGTSAASPSTVATASGPVTITTAPALAPATITVNYSQTLSYTGYPAPTSWALTSGALPQGLSLNTSTGIISGAPTVPGTFTFAVTAYNGTIPATKTFTLIVSPPQIPVDIQPAVWNGSGTVFALVEADISMFDKLVFMKNGNVLTLNADFTLTPGSTIITFTQSYLSKLPNGTYYYIAEFLEAGIDYDSTPIILIINRPNNPNNASNTNNNNNSYNKNANNDTADSLLSRSGEGGVGSGSPGTGDHEPLLLYYAAMLVSAGLMIVCIFFLIFERRTFLRKNL